VHYYIITGASRGLGRALAEAVLKQPDTAVVGVSRHATITHPRYHHQPLDLSDMEAVEHNLYKLFVPHADAHSFTLVNNAAVLGEIGYFGTHKSEHFKFVFDLNVVAPAMLMNAFLAAYAGVSVPRAILNISSGAAQRPIDGWGAYSASKAALNALSETAQKEQDLRGSGVRIRSLSPGVIDTAMQEHIRTADEAQFSDVAKFAQLHAEGHLQTPETVAKRIIEWLRMPSADGEAVVLRLGDL
jgi:benzil reductase ((S)-benzoin forming)